MPALTNRKLGYLPDVKDERDICYSAILKNVGAAPASYSIEELVLEVLEQGPVGSCVAQSVCQAIRMVEARQAQAMLPPGPRPELTSRLFTYWHARAQDGAQKIDAGTQVRTAIKVLNALGRPPERVWPHVVSDADSVNPTWARKPPPDVNTAAIDHRKATYIRVDGSGSTRIAGIKQSIANKKPVVFGTAVGYSFLENAGQTQSVMPPTNEGIAGGHAMVITAYDDYGVRIVNSWTTAWRAKGFCHLAWAYMIWPQTQDLWSIDLPEAA